ALVPLLVGEPDQQFILRVACSGGGGGYSLNLASGDSQHLHGTVQTSAPLPLDGCLIQATKTAQGDVTQYLTALDGSYDDFYRPPPPPKLPAGGASLPCAPAQQTADLPPGPHLGVDFTGTPASWGDSYEPNATANDATANAVLQLPYDSLVRGDSLS